MSKDYDRVDQSFHPAAWPCVHPVTGKERTPAWEWIASIGTVVLLAAIFVPNLVLAAMYSRRVARTATYSLVAGLVGAIILTVALVFRVKEYYLFTHYRQALYIVQWISYLAMILTSVFLICFKHCYAVPLERRVAQKDNRLPYIAGFLV